jgi:hypothetical protein
MTIDEFKIALRALLNEAVASGHDVADVIEAAEEEIHPVFDLDQI